MEKEDIMLLAQLLTGIKDAVNVLEEAQKKKDQDRLNSAKREILNLQKQINEIL